MKKILLFFLTFLVSCFPAHAETSTIPDPTFSLLGYNNSDLIYSHDSTKLQDTLTYYCTSQGGLYISHETKDTTPGPRVYYDPSTDNLMSLSEDYSNYVSSITCDIVSNISHSTSSLYSSKNISDTIYSEIAYQSNDGTYYINHKNLIDLIILICFMFFFIFTFVSLSIKFFKLGKN